MNNAHTSLPDAVQEPHRPLPAPLTPPQSDLRGLPFMPLDTCRLLDSDLFALSTGDGFKCAVALWCKAWQQVPAGSLPHNDRVLAHLSGAGGRWPALRAVALHGWVVCSDGRLYHPVIAQKANQAWKARLAQRARAARRWGREPEETAQDPSGVDKAVCHGTAGAYARESERESPSLRSQGDDHAELALGQAVRGKARAAPHRVLRAPDLAGGGYRAGRSAGRAPHPLEEQAARLHSRKAAQKAGREAGREVVHEMGQKAEHEPGHEVGQAQVHPLWGGQAGCGGQGV